MHETHAAPGIPQPLGLSTSWHGASATSMAAIMDEHEQVGFTRIEAYCHFTPPQLRELAAAARERGGQVASLHAPCPVPVTEAGFRAPWGDPLASTNEGERLRSVDTLRSTIDTAAEIGATAIVVHLGTTGVASRQRAVFESVDRYGQGSAEHRQLLEEALREREVRKGPALDAALRTIRALGEHAAGTPVRLGVEARDQYQEIPSLDEFAAVLAACEGLPVYYWHDAGHGAKLQYGGFVEHEEYLRRYGHRLLGMHVHDTLGSRDHLAPGLGETDFSMLARYLRPETFKTLELHPQATAEQIAQAVQILGALEVFGVAEGVLYQA